MNRIVFVLLLLITFTSCAQEPSTPREWLEQHLIVINEDGGYDFSELGNIIGDRRIVALGESSHGLGEFFTLKSELIQYLHKEKGFEVLAMEGGLGDINLVYSNRDTLSIEQLGDYTLFPNFKTTEIYPLMEYIHVTKDTEHPLLYTGFDTQISGGYTLRFLQKIMALYNPELSEEILPVLGAQYSISEKARANDSIGYEVERNQFMRVANETRAALIAHKSDICKKFGLNEFQFKILDRTVVMFYKAVDLSYENNYQSYALRDQLMAENFEWLLTEVYPNKKIIIWAHNGHIEKGSSVGYNMKMMGHYAKEQYDDDYYALGLFAYKGEAYQHWTQKSVPFENSGVSSIERRMVDRHKKTSFLDLTKIEESSNTQWLFEAVDGLEFENGGIISFVPKNRFDGIIMVYESGNPTYND